jgi:uncharacterized protein (TIGR01777 family)
MRVIITGGTGLIGTSLVEILAPHTHEIIILSRDPDRAAQRFRDKSVQALAWDARTDQGWGHLITPDTAIVNLAGENPAHWHWTAAHKQRVLNSRIQAGQAIMQAIEHHGSPQVILQSSASGYYGDRGQEILTESSEPGQGFRAEVCEAWEAVTANVNARRCILRTGIVLHQREGAFPPMRLFAQLFGSQLGNGQQWIPWIHHRDVANAIRFLLENTDLSGPFNVSGPEPVTNRELITTTGRLLKRPSLISVPAVVLRLVLGEESVVVLESERIIPKRLLEAGFTFDYPQLDQALRDILSR